MAYNIINLDDICNSIEDKNDERDNNSGEYLLQILRDLSNLEG